jgi:hypothetical protein
VSLFRGHGEEASLWEEIWGTAESVFWATGEEFQDDGREAFDGGGSLMKAYGIDGRVVGAPAGLRIVLSRDRTEKGLEIAPKGRPYVSCTVWTEWPY